MGRGVAEKRRGTERLSTAIHRFESRSGCVGTTSGLKLLLILVLFDNTGAVMARSSSVRAVEHARRVWMRRT